MTTDVPSASSAPEDPPQEPARRSFRLSRSKAGSGGLVGVLLLLGFCVAPALSRATHPGSPSPESPPSEITTAMVLDSIGEANLGRTC